MYRQGAETALYRTEISKRNSLGNLLYKSVSNVNSFEGVTSGLNTVKLDSSADRIGTFYLKNLVQTTQSSGGRNGRRLSVSLSSSYAEFKNVGEYVEFEREAREYIFSHSLTQSSHSCHLYNP